MPRQRRGDLRKLRSNKLRVRLAKRSSLISQNILDNILDCFFCGAIWRAMAVVLRCVRVGGEGGSLWLRCKVGDSPIWKDRSATEERSVVHAATQGGGVFGQVFGFSVARLLGAAYRG